MEDNPSENKYIPALWHIDLTEWMFKATYVLNYLVLKTSC